LGTLPFETIGRQGAFTTTCCKDKDPALPHCQVVLMVIWPLLHLPLVKVRTDTLNKFKFPADFEFSQLRLDAAVFKTY